MSQVGDTRNWNIVYAVRTFFQKRTLSPQRSDNWHGPIKVAQYYTKLPDKKLLSEKLQRAIAIAREHYAEQLANAKDRNLNSTET